MIKRVSAIVVPLAIGLAPLPALADGTLLRYQWNAGDQATYNVISEAAGDMVLWIEAAGEGKTLELQVSSVAKLPIYRAVESVDEGGHAAVSYRMGEMQIDVTATDQPKTHFVVDPAGQTISINGKQLPMPEAAQWYFSRPMHMVVSSLGEVLEFYAPFSHDELFDMARFSPAQYAQMARVAQVQLPRDPIQEGHSWAQTSDLSFYAPSEDEAQEEGTKTLPMIMTMVYTLTGFEKTQDANCAKIEVVGLMELKEPTTIPISLAGMQFTVVVGPARVSIRGFSYFDYENGCLVKSEMDTIMNMQQEVDGELSFAGRTGKIHTETTWENFKTHIVLTRESGA